MLLSIIVLNYNRLHYTKKTIQRLIEATTVNHEFIFVDNNSTKESGVKQYLKSIETKTNARRVKCVFNPRNFGVGGGRNSGIRIARGDFIMTIDDDIWVPDNYDKIIIDAFRKVPNLGLLGINVEKKTYPLRDFGGIKLQIKKGNLGGGSLIMSRKTFDKIGYFNAEFVYGLEDVDMCNRLSVAKMLCGYIEQHGKHLDRHINTEYIALKKKIHQIKSVQYRRIEKYYFLYKAGRKSTYVPYKDPVFDTVKFDRVITGKR